MNLASMGDTTWIQVFATRYFLNPDILIELTARTNISIEKMNRQAVRV